MTTKSPLYILQYFIANIKAQISGWYQENIKAFIYDISEDFHVNYWYLRNMLSNTGY